MTRRKDRVLNTRIPEELDRELREQAARLDVSVSQLVRDVLEKTVDLVGNISGNVEHLVQDIVEDVSHLRRVGSSARGPRATAVKEIAAAVIGWQEITTQRPARCAVTGENVLPGDAAYLGIRADGKPSVVIASAALPLVLAPPAASWSSLVLQRPVTCALTGEAMRVGDTAYFDPAEQPPRFACRAAYDRVLAGEDLNGSRDAHAATDDGAEP